MSVKFNEHCGRLVRLSDDGCTAEYTGGFVGYGTVLSGRSLSPGKPFMVQIQATWQGDRQCLCLGVTSQDPDTRPELSWSASDIKDSRCVDGRDTWQDGEKTGQWGGDLRVSPGDTVGVVWDSQAVSIIMDGTTTQVFTNVPGPVWALADVSLGVRRMSVVTPEPKTVVTKKKSVRVTRKPAPVSPRRGTSKPASGGLAGAMNEMSLGGPGTQFMGASGGVTRTPRRTSSITCPYWQVCDRFIDSLGLPDVYFDPTYDQCYCWNCVISRGDNLYYDRGDPPKLYGLPGGWCRFGLSVPPQAHGMKAFERWHVAYHGTIPKNIQPIIESHNLLMPGDYTIEGKLLVPPPGHFTEERKPEDFDIKQVFVSPTITYAGHPVYARPQSWTDPITGKPHDIQVAIQVRIKPDAYQVGKETLGLGRNKIDAKLNNSELEWSTKIRGATIMQGILVKPLIGDSM